ncbi:MAG: hypothetical protein M3198_17545 [Actinomycetota bacterium]|nr:hypothetical protein [Actinomycetota bacterium]
MSELRRSPRWILITAALCSVLAAAPAVASRVADFARNAGKVDGLDANELVRASSSVATGHLSDFHSRGFANVQRSRVQAPVKGVLLVWSGLSVGWDDDSDPGTYAGMIGRIRVDRRVAGAPQQLEISRSTRAGTQHLSLSAAVPVKAGPHRVSVQLRTAQGEALTYVHQRHVETLFVPFGSRGVRGSL